jgi:hypothetical protein
MARRLIVASAVQMPATRPWLARLVSNTAGPLAGIDVLGVVVGALSRRD